MDQTQKISIQDTYKGPRLDRDHGYFTSATIALPTERVFAACQEQTVIQNVLTDLPEDVENFLDLSLESAERTGESEYRVAWQNASRAKFSGNLTFLLSEAPANRGTILSAEATFSDFDFTEEGPSTLMNLFVRRMKSFIECGEIATTKGQPSGREEITESQDSLH